MQLLHLTKSSNSDCENHTGTEESKTTEMDSLFNSSNWVLQVHIRTPPDASPENVGVFVGSDPTDSVTALCWVRSSTSFQMVYTRRGKEQTPTHETQPKTGNPERQEKEKKRETDGKQNKTSGQGGRQKLLNQPDTAQTYNNLSTQRAKPTWRAENAWCIHNACRVCEALGIQVTTLWTA